MNSPLPRLRHFRKCDGRRRAFSLAELVVSTAVMTALLAGMGSAMLIAARGLPREGDPSTLRADALQALDLMSEDVLYATSITQRTSNRLELFVPDRDNNAAPEQIAYQWYNTDPPRLLRTLNANDPQVLLSGLSAFQFTYDVGTLESSTTQLSTTVSSETVLSSFDGWSGLLVASVDIGLGRTNEACQYVEITPPDGAVELTFTRAELMMRRVGTPPAGARARVIMCHAKSAGSMEPATTKIGALADVLISTLPTSYTRTEFLFANAVDPDPKRKGYCIHVTTIANGEVDIQAYNSPLAPDNNMALLTSSDGGSTWRTAPLLPNSQDAIFYLYGKYTTVGKDSLLTQRHFVRAVNIRFVVATEPPTPVNSTIEMLNAPEVATP